MLLQCSLSMEQCRFFFEKLMIFHISEIMDSFFCGWFVDSKWWKSSWASADLRRMTSRPSWPWRRRGGVSGRSDQLGEHACPRWEAPVHLLTCPWTSNPGPSEEPWWFGRALATKRSNVEVNSALSPEMRVWSSKKVALGQVECRRTLVAFLASVKRLLCVGRGRSANLVHHPLTEDHGQLGFWKDDLAFVQDRRSLCETDEWRGAPDATPSPVHIPKEAVYRNRDLGPHVGACQQMLVGVRKCVGRLHDLCNLDPDKRTTAVWWRCRQCLRCRGPNDRPKVCAGATCTLHECRIARTHSCPANRLQGPFAISCDKSSWKVKAQQQGGDVVGWLAGGDVTLHTAPLMDRREPHEESTEIKVTRTPCHGSLSENEISATFDSRRLIWELSQIF